jgi:hypothetical protein
MEQELLRGSEEPDPALQFMHTNAVVALEYVPTEQSILHDEEDGVEEVPGRQFVQIKADEEFEYRPAGQLLQTPAPLDDPVPGAQSAQIP